MPSEAQKKATLKYKRENYKRIPLDLQKPYYEELQRFVKSCGSTVNGFIKEAISEKMERDREKQAKNQTDLSDQEWHEDL